MNAFLPALLFNAKEVNALFPNNPSLRASLALSPSSQNELPLSQEQLHSSSPDSFGRAKIAAHTRDVWGKDDGR